MFCSESVGVENELKKAAQAAEKELLRKTVLCRPFADNRETL
jgi:hypothetical protein